jgi:hypothetical protein
MSRTPAQTAEPMIGFPFAPNQVSVGAAGVRGSSRARQRSQADCRDMCSRVAISDQGLPRRRAVRTAMMSARSRSLEPGEHLRRVPSAEVADARVGTRSSR